MNLINIMFDEHYSVGHQRQGQSKAALPPGPSKALTESGSHRSGAQALGQASAAEPQRPHCLGEGRGHIPSSTCAALSLCYTRLLTGPLLQVYRKGSLRCKAFRRVLAHLINTTYRLAAFIIFLLCSLLSPPPPLTPLPPPFPPLLLQSLPPVTNITISTHGKTQPQGRYIM